MARRSPTNARYQKYTEPAGKTRKSAAAAKPKRKEGATSAEASKPKTKSAVTRKYDEPDTPEYKFWRRMWWSSLLAGVALVSISLLIQYVLHAKGVLLIVSEVLVALSYLTLLAAFLVDYFRLRPMRTGTYDPTKGKKDAAPDSKDSDAGTSGDE